MNPMHSTTRRGPAIIKIGPWMSHLALFGAGLLCGWLFLGDRNSALSYGSNGIPTNCLAIIAANIDGWRGNDRGVRYTAEAALASIDRYCGANGSSWK